MLAALGLWVAVVGVLYAALPASPDQYELDYLGWRLLAGDRLYVDVVDENWPFGVWLHALSTFLFGNQLYAWRILDFLLMLLGLAFLADLVRRIWGRTVALGVLALYPALYVTVGGIWIAGQRDLVCGHVLFIALWFDWLAWQRGKSALQLGTGAGLAMAFLTKPTSGFLGPALILIAWMRIASERERMREAVGHLLIAGVTSAISVLAGLAIVLALGTPLEAIRDALLTMNLPAYRGESASWNRLATTALEQHGGSWPWISALALGACISIWFNGSRWARSACLGLVLLAFSGLLSYLLQARGFAYHLGLYFTALLALACIGAGRLLRSANSGTRTGPRLAAGALLLLVVLGTGLKLRNTLAAPALWLTGSESDANYFARYEAGGVLTVADAVALSERARAQIPAGETLLVWSTTSLISFLAEIPQPTRFFYFPTLARALPDTELGGRWNEAFREDLERGPPAWCYVDREAMHARFRRMPAWRDLNEFLRERYFPLEMDRGLELYERRPAQSAF